MLLKPSKMALLYPNSVMSGLQKEYTVKTLYSKVLGNRIGNCFALYQVQSTLPKSNLLGLKKWLRLGENLTYVR